MHSLWVIVCEITLRLPRRNVFRKYQSSLLEEALQDSVRRGVFTKEVFAILSCSKWSRKPGATHASVRTKSPLIPGRLIMCRCRVHMRRSPGNYWKIWGFFATANG